MPTPSNFEEDTNKKPSHEGLDESKRFPGKMLGQFFQ